MVEISKEGEVIVPQELGVPEGVKSVEELKGMSVGELEKYEEEFHKRFTYLEENNPKGDKIVELNRRYNDKLKAELLAKRNQEIEDRR